jgi:hypothetical protein
LLDLALPYAAGIEALRHIRAKNRSCRWYF